MFSANLPALTRRMVGRVTFLGATSPSFTHDDAGDQNRIRKGLDWCRNHRGYPVPIPPLWVPVAGHDDAGDQNRIRRDLGWDRRAQSRPCGFLLLDSQMSFSADRSSE